MAHTPYSGLPAHCFWRKAHDVAEPGDIDPVVAGKFRIAPGDRLATAGSCFAQHLSAHLKSAGYNYFVTETAHDLVADSAAGYNYGVFSARYGNIYTAAQFRQLFDRAYGKFAPEDQMWTGEDGHYYDPFRPAIQPEGFASRAEFDADRRQHFAAVRRLFNRSKVFIFTLGLTEAWRSRRDGAVYPLCPGVAAGRFDAERHAFVNFTVAEIVEDLGYVIRNARRRNPGLKFILTVSPVPLIATALDRSVITSTIYSKSVLRVAAEQLAESFEDVAYFPSYEIITGPAARGRYFAADCREVLPEGVAHVMRLFMRHYAEGTAESSPDMSRHPRRRMGFRQTLRDAEKRMQVVCDEDVLDAATPGDTSGTEAGNQPPAPGPSRGPQR